MTVASAVTRCALFAWLVAICSGGVSSAVAALPSPLAFEDRNNNGVFDGSDVDITDTLRFEWVFETDQSVVIARGPLKVYDPLGTNGSCVGLFIIAGRNITVNGSITNPGYAGVVELFAGDAIRIGDKVTLSGAIAVDLSAPNDISIGNNVKMQAKGSGGFGEVTIYSGTGSIHIGSKVQITTLTDSRFYAGGGGLSFGTGSQITSSRAGVDLNAWTKISADGVRLKAKDLMSIFSLSGRGPISLRSSTLAVARDGSIHIDATLGSVDLSGARYNVAPEVTAPRVVW